MELLFKFLLIFVLIIVYYGAFVKRLAGLAEFIVNRLHLARRNSWGAANSVIHLALAAVTQFFFLLALLLITGVHFTDLGLNRLRPILIVYGVLLGIGEMALSSFITHLSMRATMSLAPDRVPSEIEEWFVIAKGGWVRFYWNTIESAPLPVALFLSLVYVFVEEVIFRGFVISYFLINGTAWALAVSIFFFVLVQIINMPDWRGALFPALGAVIVGLLHGSIFLAIPEAYPLIVAHFVFFITVIL